MKYFLLLSLFLSPLTLLAQNDWRPSQGLDSPQYNYNPFSEINEEQPKSMIINNRVLTTINGTPITVLDVAKKMDLLFYQTFPDLSNSEVAKHQFYVTNWKFILGELIDDELIFTDAIDKKVPISDGDIREEMEKLLGPNVVIHIDKLGMTFEEVWNMLKRDIHVRRMMYVMVYSKAISSVTPERIRESYKNFITVNSKPQEWFYNVLSIRGNNSSLSSTLAQKAYNLLENNEIDLTSIQETLESDPSYDSEITITLSEEYHRTDKDVSPSHKKILVTLQENGISQPFQQQSRSDQSYVHRIYVLNKHLEGGIISFDEVQEQLSEEIIKLETSRISVVYLDKLRKRYGVNEEMLLKNIPNNFEPFILQ